jgi:hypothetical protein
MVDQLSHAAFAPLVETPFQLGDGALALTLVEVSPLRVSARSESFALVFCDPARAGLPQGEYQLAHAALGQFPLFIVPIGEDARGLLYEATFNRLRPEGSP